MSTEGGNEPSDIVNTMRGEIPYPYLALFRIPVSRCYYKAVPGEIFDD